MRGYGSGPARSFPTKDQAFCVALLQQIAVTLIQSLGAGQDALQGLAAEVTLRRALKVLVPDIVEGVIEANALEAMVEADGPVLLRGACREGDLGEVFEAEYLRLIHFGSE